MRLSALAVVLSASILALVLVSGKATVNFTHTPKLSTIAHDPYYFVIDRSDSFDIHLSNEIDQPWHYHELITRITSVKKPINLYLSGRGGYISTTMGLYFALKSTRQPVTTHVIGNVSSAHAFLAISFDRINIVDSNILFMFHIAGVDIDGNTVKPEDFCKTIEGSDRGFTKASKCLAHTRAMAWQMSRTIQQNVTRFLTAEEIVRFLEGQDIIIDGNRILEGLK